ncbi:MAG: prepilin-type N-terminal cleavage/methylation domain-containing protein [Hydrogenobaculum sp.]|jgi:prepilin-type N-terminal cleavage/methylation domain-containing protein
MYGQCISKNNQKGFTLLETLAAFIVFVVMIAGAYSLLIQAIKLHQRQQALTKDAFILFNKLKYTSKHNSIKHIHHFNYQVIRYHNLKVVKFLPQ